MRTLKKIGSLLCLVACMGLVAPAMAATRGGSKDFNQKPGTSENLKRRGALAFSLADGKGRVFKIVCMRCIADSTESPVPVNDTTQTPPTDDVDKKGLSKN